MDNKIPNEVLVFTHFNQVELFDVQDTVKSGKLFDKFMDIYDSLDETIKKHHDLYLVINKNIEVMNIVHLEKDYLP